MKIIYFRKGKKLVPGIVTEEGIIDINNSLKNTTRREFSDFPLNFDDLEELKLIKERVLHFNDEEFLREEELIIGPCVPRPSKIICVGLNYRNHAKESGMVETR